MGKVILDQIVSDGRRRDLPPLPQTTNSVHLLSNHYLITHFQFSTSIGVLTAKVDVNDEIKMSAKDRVCLHTYTHKYICTHEHTHTHTHTQTEKESWEGRTSVVGTMYPLGYKSFLTS